MSKKLESAFNKQINHELAAAYSYLAMAAWCEAENYQGFAKWFKVQHREELKHAMKFYDHVMDRGGKVIFEALAAPVATYKSPKHIFEAALALEQGNTKVIHALYEIALKEGDYAAQPTLHWFIDEQIEEEKSVGDIIALMDLAADNRSAILMLNAKLGERAGE
ncbi:MAG: ferritin [Phycisphaerales bacterium]|nr:ferritin [Phycisphaerales bacterium]